MDTYHNETKTIIEIEAGRGVANNQFLKDLFEACVIPDIDVLVIAVLNEYHVGDVTNKDFETVVKIFETLYVSDRMNLPLKSILVIGY